MSDDQKLARRMLEIRQNGFRRILMRTFLPYYLGYAVMIALAYCLLIPIHQQTAFVFITGLFFGVILRDIGWIRRQIQFRPMSERITNWELVHEIAERNEAIENR